MYQTELSGMVSATKMIAFVLSLQLSVTLLQVSCSHVLDSN